MELIENIALFGNVYVPSYYLCDRVSDIDMTKLPHSWHGEYEHAFTFLQLSEGRKYIQKPEGNEKPYLTNGRGVLDVELRVLCYKRQTPIALPEEKKAFLLEKNPNLCAPKIVYCWEVGVWNLVDYSLEVEDDDDYPWFDPKGWFRKRSFAKY